MKIDEPEELKIIEAYQNGVSLRELARFYGTDKGTIKRRLLKHNIKLRTLSDSNRIYSLDENIFAKLNQKTNS